MSQQLQAIQRFQKRLALLLFARQALRFLAVYTFLWGTLALVLRVTFATPRLWLLAGLAGVPVTLLAAWRSLRRHLPAAGGVRALLDQRGHCGGLLMAQDEIDLGNWDENLPDVTAPQLVWDGRRLGGVLAVAAAFVLVCFLLPDRLISSPDHEFDVRREASKLSRQIDVLKEEAIVDTERAEALKQKLDQVQALASGHRPAKTLEALDHLKDQIAKAAQGAAEAAARTNEQMAAAKAVAEALKKAGPALSQEKKTAAMVELGKLLAKAAAENDLLSKELDAKEAAPAGERQSTFDPEKLKLLSEALKGAGDELQKRLERLERAGLLTAEDIKKCAGEGLFDPEALAKFLAENDTSLEEALAKCQHPGRGGVSEDEPSDIDLTLGDPSSPEGVEWKEQALPPPALRALKDSQVTKVTRATPQKADAEPAAAGALARAAAGGGSANAPVVLPRHRGAVERYFERAPGPVNSSAKAISGK